VLPRGSIVTRFSGERGGVNQLWGDARRMAEVSRAPAALGEAPAALGEAERCSRWREEAAVSRGVLKGDMTWFKTMMVMTWAWRRHSLTWWCGKDL